MNRFDAARTRLRQRENEIAFVKARPCLQCEFYEISCIHPSVAAVTCDPVTGAVSMAAANAEQARSEDGACGPEGALFSERGPVGQFIVWGLATNKGRLVFLAAFLLFLTLIS